MRSVWSAGVRDKLRRGVRCPFWFALPENLAYSDLGLGLHTGQPVANPLPVSGAACAVGCAGRRRERVRRRVCTEQSFAGDRPAGVRCADANTGALPLSVEGRRALRRAPFDFNCHAAGDQCGALQQPLHRPAAACTAAADDFSIVPIAFAELLRQPSHQLSSRYGTAISCSSTISEFFTGAAPSSSANHARHLRGCYLHRDSVSRKPLYCAAGWRSRSRSDRHRRNSRDLFPARDLGLFRRERVDGRACSASSVLCPCRRGTAAADRGGAAPRCRSPCGGCAGRPCGLGGRRAAPRLAAAGWPKDFPPRCSNRCACTCPQTLSLRDEPAVCSEK